MDLDLSDNLPVPTISLSSMSRSWSAGMSKFLNFPDDLPCGDEDHRFHLGGHHQRDEESRYHPLSSSGRGILIEGSGEYVHPQHDWASPPLKRHHVDGSHYYSSSIDSVSTTETTPSPTSTNSHTFLSSDARSVRSSCSSSDTDPSSIATVNSDGNGSGTHPVYPHSLDGHVPTSPAFTAQAYSDVSHTPHESSASQISVHPDSPLSIYSASLALSSTPSPHAAPYLPPQDDGLLSPLQLRHRHDTSGVTVNMSDVYSPTHPSQDTYPLSFPDSVQSHQFPRFTPPPHPSSPSFEAGLGGQFGYHSPLRNFDAEVTGGLGKRNRGSSSFGDIYGDRKRARQVSPIDAPLSERRKRGRPRKADQAPVTATEAIVSPPRHLSDSDEEYADHEEDGDSDDYVPSDEEGGTHRRRGRSGRHGAHGSRGGNAEALRALEHSSTNEGVTGNGWGDSGYSGYPSGAQETSLQSQRRPHPVPVPHLSKKSRGRKVPVSGGDDASIGDGSTAYDHYDLPSGPVDLSLDIAAPRGRPTRTHQHDTIYDIPSQPQSLDALPPGVGVTEAYKIVSGGIKKLTGERRYVCTADGCGKCFVRGEHLKRHVRSLHTWEKRKFLSFASCVPFAH
ncbi:hypothetical protein PQX77_014331 [Marasmius sp. AFHP31]|nr:hypothetical protein PQX77_014331 [Marasmius sp. AFHP31]